MIVNKEFQGKERVIIECREDILFGYTNVVDDSIIVSFCDTQGKHDLDVDMLTEGKTWEELDPKVLLSFNNPKSISNLIDILSDAKETLEKAIEPVYVLPKRKDRHG